jgi:hypothetical protein
MRQPHFVARQSYRQATIVQAIVTCGTHREHQNDSNVIHEGFCVNIDSWRAARFSQFPSRWLPPMAL